MIGNLVGLRQQSQRVARIAGRKVDAGITNLIDQYSKRSEEQICAALG